MLLSVAVVPVSAATSTTTPIRYNVNKIEVTTYQELMDALETKSEETNPADLYVVVQNDINEEWNGYTDIAITYPGNVTLDLNGHIIKMTSPNADSMFLLKGENPTNFTITNTGKKENGDNKIGNILLYSDVSSSVILSQNINATINIIGRHEEYDSNDIGNTAVWNNDIGIYMEYADPKTEEKGYTYYTIWLQKINKIYISNACIQNNTATAYNLYVNQINEYQSYPVTITGKSEFLNREYDLTGANIYFAPRTYSGDFYEWLGSCYIEGGEADKTTYQSISATINGTDKLTWKSVLVGSFRVASGSTEMPEKTEVYNFNSKDLKTKITDRTTEINTYKDIFIRRSCCEGNYAETTYKTVTQLGHLYKCQGCDGARTYDFHDFKQTSKGTAATCVKRGISEKYECDIDGCVYYKGGEILPIDSKNHDKDRLVITKEAVAATCTRTGNTAEVKCKDCKATVQEMRRINKLAHTATHHDKVDATCINAGNVEYWSCSKCNKNFSDENCTTEITDITIPIDSSKHMSMKVLQKIPATCTKTGTERAVYCKDCKKTTAGGETIAIDPTNHTNTEERAEVAATCSTPGAKAGTYCKDCNKYVSGGATIPALNHKNTKNVPEQAATFTSVGYTAGVYCNDCKKYISGHVEIPKLTQKFTDSDVAIYDGTFILANPKVTVGQILTQAASGSVVKKADGSAVSKDALLESGMTLTFPDGTKALVVVLGDVNGDGTITAADARLALRISVDLEKYEEGSPYKKSSDVNGDTKTTAADARMILRASVELDDLSIKAFK